mgnify:CR=1 FL=1
MELKTTIDGSSATIVIVGNLTVATAPSLEAAFLDLPESVTDITFDLTDLVYVASAGLRVIVFSEKEARQRGGSVCLAHPNDEVMEVLDVTGLVDILNIER